MILDAAVATAMESVDLCIVGAGRAVNGGVGHKARRRARSLSLTRARACARARRSSQPPAPRSQVGTHQIALCAKAHGKPLYVAAESGRSGMKLRPSFPRHTWRRACRARGPPARPARATA